MKLKLLLFFGLAITTCLAEDIYVSQLGNGTTNSLSWLNAAGNWGAGAGKVSPGDTVHLVGTFSNPLNIPANGSAGSPITIYFEPDAKFSAFTVGGYGSTFIGIGSRSYITIDGGVNGLIECTAQGTGLAYSNNNFGIYGEFTKGIIVKNLGVYNMYNRTPNSTDPNVLGESIRILNSSDLIVSNCVCSNASSGIDCNYSYSYSSNIVIVSNIIKGTVWGLIVSTTGTDSTMKNVSIIGNRISQFNTFAGTVGHKNGMYFWNNNSIHNSGISNLWIEGNSITSGDNGCAPLETTGGISFESFYQDSTKYVRIVNNFLKVTSPMAWQGNGFIPTQGVTDCVIANNTMVGWLDNSGIGWGGTIGGGGTNYYIYNNLFVGVGMIEAYGDPIDSNTNTKEFNLAGMAGYWSDYNILPSTGQGNCFYVWRHHWFRQPGGFTWEDHPNTLADWQAYYTNHFDPHSTTNIPILDVNYIPTTDDVVARAAGTNLTAWGITKDYLGNTRPATGNWTIGAFETVGTTTNIIVDPPGGGDIEGEGHGTLVATNAGIVIRGNTTIGSITISH